MQIASTDLKNCFDKPEGTDKNRYICPYCSNNGLSEAGNLIYDPKNHHISCLKNPRHSKELTDFILYLKKKSKLLSTKSPTIFIPSCDLTIRHIKMSDLNDIERIGCYNPLTIKYPEIFKDHFIDLLYHSNRPIAFIIKKGRYLIGISEIDFDYISTKQGYMRNHWVRSALAPDEWYETFEILLRYLIKFAIDIGIEGLAVQSRDEEEIQALKDFYGFVPDGVSNYGPSFRNGSLLDIEHINI